MIKWKEAVEVSSVPKNGQQKVTVKRIPVMRNGKRETLIDVRIHNMNEATSVWKHTIKGFTIRAETAAGVAAAILEAVGDGGAVAQKETDTE